MKMAGEEVGTSSDGDETGRRRAAPHASRDGRLQNGQMAARNSRIRDDGRPPEQWISGGMRYP
jgi:hypothetical protein